jgi:lipopolysaccharide/colanic/teichoic acid biosynthesis glycosyltransferase
MPKPWRGGAQATRRIAPVALRFRFRARSGPRAIDPKLLRNVRPGIVGWVQIHEQANKATQTSNKCRSRLEDDCYYVANRSFLLDMKILVHALFRQS